MPTHTSFEDGKLIVTRTYDAPRDRVFEAWIETSKVQQWWGCANCTDVRSEVEAKVGGAYNHHMTVHGQDIPGFATLTEYDPPNRRAFRMAGPDGSDTGMQVTVEFKDVDGGTLVRLIHEGIPDIRVEGDVELRAIVREGWTAAFGKLSTLLEPTPQSS